VLEPRPPSTARSTCRPTRARSPTSAPGDGAPPRPPSAVEVSPEGDIGNDHPFAPVYPYTDTSVPQRTADVEAAKALLAEAGVSGFEVELSTWDNYEIPQLAQLVQSAAKEVGITLTLNITDAGTYYSDFWLSSPIGITDYGPRGVPNVFLTAALLTDGSGTPPTSRIRR
jgi:ABC-type transport system substrate-binding protein